MRLMIIEELLNLNIKRSRDKFFLVLQPIISFSIYIFLVRLKIQ